jgi:hypothetical protein
MKFYLTTEKKEILSFLGKWMELENIILNEISQIQKAKATCSPSYVDYRPKINADVGHTKGRMLMGDIVQAKEAKNLNVVDVLSVQE